MDRGQAYVMFFFAFFFWLVIFLGSFIDLPSIIFIFVSSNVATEIFVDICYIFICILCLRYLVGFLESMRFDIKVILSAIFTICIFVLVNEFTKDYSIDFSPLDELTLLDILYLKFSEIVICALFYMFFVLMSLLFGNCKSLFIPSHQVGVSALFASSFQLVYLHQPWFFYVDFVIFLLLFAAFGLNFKRFPRYAKMTFLFVLINLALLFGSIYIGGTQIQTLFSVRYFFYLLVVIFYIMQICHQVKNEMVLESRGWLNVHDSK